MGQYSCEAARAKVAEAELVEEGEKDTQPRNCKFALSALQTDLYPGAGLIKKWSA